LTALALKKDDALGICLEAPSSKFRDLAGFLMSSNLIQRGTGIIQKVKKHLHHVLLLFSVEIQSDIISRNRIFFAVEGNIPRQIDRRRNGYHIPTFGIT
jgi:hypothetical protein